MNLKVVAAIFKRNFFAYFTNPLGYVFICAFVLISAFAQFWPHEFFNANLATLGQLNKWMPVILLLFVPAVTMSIWADERRQGTDELLLTIPASDLDVVIGKYLAAVAIFTVALLFSLSNPIFLATLGDPDGGLLFSTYLGYWLLGVAMLAVGMVASFLTSNLTVGFILGVALNAPLVGAQAADAIFADTALAQQISQWSMAHKFADLARGVISLSSVVYFAALVAIGLYLSLILIGRRHWVTGRSGGSMLGHFVARGVSVAAIAVCLSYIFATHDARVDASSERLNSLAPQTLAMLGKLDKNIHIEAFVSPVEEVPEAYIRTRLNLLTTLDEMAKQSGGKVDVRLHEIKRFDEQATIAEQVYDIKPQSVFTRERGKFDQYEIFLGVALTSGLDKEVIPFFDRGVPIEYELIRSITALAERQPTRLFDLDTALAAKLDKATSAAPLTAPFKDNGYELDKDARLEVVRSGNQWKVTDKSAVYRITKEQPPGQDAKLVVYRVPQRRSLGVVKTDAPLFGSFNPQTMSSGQDEQLITELRKVYDVQELDPSQPITKKYDALLIVQPSSLGQPQLDNVLAALRKGQKAAIFEDPAPIIWRGRVVGTADPKMPQRGPMGRPQMPQPKGDISALWRLLGVHFSLNHIAINPTEPQSPVGAPLYFNRQTKLATFASRGDDGMVHKRIGATVTAYEPGQAFVYFAGESKNPMGGSGDLVVISQNYNPFPKIAEFPDEYVFIGSGSGASQAFNPDQPITAGMQHLLLLCTGWMTPQADTTLSFTPLVRTSQRSSIVDTDDLFTRNPFGMEEMNPKPDRLFTGLEYVPAARITGRPSSGAAPIDVVLVADIDCISTAFFNVRNRGENEVIGAFLDLDNVSFALNVIDELAGDERFIPIRNRRRTHRTLTAFEKTTEDARVRKTKADEQLKNQFNQAIEDANDELRKRVDAIRRKPGMDQRQFDIQVAAAEEQLSKALRVKQAQLERDRDKKTQKADADLELEIRRMQNRVKRMAVFIPPILPLLIGVGVFIWRRSRELEGAVKSRIR